MVLATAAERRSPFPTPVVPTRWKAARSDAAIAVAARPGAGVCPHRIVPKVRTGSVPAVGVPGGVSASPNFVPVVLLGLRARLFQAQECVGTGQLGRNGAPQQRQRRHSVLPSGRGCSGVVGKVTHKNQRRRRGYIPTTAHCDKARGV